MISFSNTARKAKNSTNVLVTSGRSFLFLTHTNGSMLLADSHCHQVESCGTVIMDNGDYLVQCLEELMESDWTGKLDSFSSTAVRYNLPVN